MKNAFFAIAGSALIALSTVQFASATEQHNRAHHRATEFRNSNAFVAPAYEAAPADAYRYSGGYSAPAGR
jgi:hypothetical protein